MHNTGNLSLSQCDREVLAALSRHGLRALVIGGRAVSFYGARERSEDLDVLVGVGPEVGEKLPAALTELGCDVSRHPTSRFGEPGKQIPIKHYDFNADILTAIPGLDFERAFARSIAVEVGGLEVRVLALEDLLHSKREAGRPLDVEDMRALEALRL